MAGVRDLVAILRSIVLTPVVLMGGTAALAAIAGWPLTRALPEGLFWGGLTILGFAWLTASPFAAQAAAATFSPRYRRGTDLSRLITPHEVHVLILGTAGAVSSIALAPVMGASGALALGILLVLAGGTGILRAVDALRKDGALSDS